MADVPGQRLPGGYDGYRRSTERDIRLVSSEPR